MASKLTIASVLILIIIFFGFGILSGDTTFPKRSSMAFDSGWTFKKEEDSSWTRIDLPHTVNIEPLVVNDQWQGISWYRKSFTLEDVDNQNVFLEFEGVMQEATVWVNGDSVANHVGGYLPFTVDITDQVQTGVANLIELRVENTDDPMIPPGKPLNTLDFNFYGGIYRNVKLIVTNQVYISSNVQIDEPGGGGVMVHFNKVEEGRAEGEARIHVVNSTAEPSQVSAKAILTGPQGEKWTFESEKTKLNGNAANWLYVDLTLDNPALWSVTKPQLYNLQVSLFADGTEADQTEEKVGVRSIFLNDEGFFLNGQKCFIRGTNRHQEYPYVGYALSDEANFRDALKIKNAGFDFVRLSHYPHSESFLDACDELGLLVMNAIPGWQWFKEDSVFLNNSYQDISDMVRRDRNHPSVVFWEVSLNESRMSDEYMNEANRILREELPFEDTYSAGWMDHASYDLFIPARQHSKPPDYWNFYKEGSRKIFIAEYGDWEYYAQNAGFNQKAFADLQEEERTSRQLRKAGERRLLQQALNYQEAANSNRKGMKAGTIGHANWLMFDYNRGYADDIESSGISDIFRIPKFAYYFYQSQRDADELIDHPNVESGPMVKIATYWTDQSPLDIKIFSNCEEVELYLDDQLIGRKKPDRSSISDHLDHPPFIFSFDTFQPGVLKAVGIFDGKIVAEDIVSTPGPPAALRLVADISGRNCSWQSKDMLFLYAQVVDEKGTVVPHSELPVTFSLEGGGRLVGENPVKADAGIATILYQSSQQESPPRLVAKAPGLLEASFSFPSDQTK